MFRAACLAALACATALAAPTVSAGPILDRIAEKGEIVFGFRADAPPFSFVDGERARGFSVDLCGLLGGAVVDTSGLESLTARFVEVSAENRFDKIEAGEIDVLCGATTATLGRRARVSFTIPTFFSGVGAAVRADAAPLLREVLVEQTVATASRTVVEEGLGGARLGLRAGTTAARWLESAGIAAIEGVAVTEMPSHFDGLTALRAGEIDAYLADLAILKGLTAEDREGLVLSRRTFTNEPYALAIPRGDEDLRLALDRALSHLYRTGAIFRIFAKHFGNPSPEVIFFYAAVALPE